MRVGARDEGLTAEHRRPVPPGRHPRRGGVQREAVQIEALADLREQPDVAGLRVEQLRVALVPAAGEVPGSDAEPLTVLDLKRVGAVQSLALLDS